mmetsp:Transcript_36224/g.35834  ORF Transcript_36224/g.35834 Transcript_36224/m.35834 type:complete len:191 (-) Transcript_36224:722-1294(-)
MRSKIYTNEDILFSKMFFNAWNWNVYTHEDYFEAISYIKNETSTTIYEDIIREKVKNRTKEQKFDLVIRRMIFITLNVILIIAGVGAIFAANLFNNDIQNSISGPSYATALIPSLIVSFVNGIVPAMTKRITACEKYDFANTLLKQQIWRMFAIKILNLTIFMLLNRELAFNDGIFASSPIIEFDTEVYD